MIECIEVTIVNQKVQKKKKGSTDKVDQIQCLKCFPDWGLSLTQRNKSQKIKAKLCKLACDLILNFE